MIALAGLVVVAQDAFPAAHVCEPAFVAVWSIRRRPGKFPEDHFDESALFELLTFAEEELRSHVGAYTNVSLRSKLRVGFSVRAGRLNDDRTGPRGMDDVSRAIVRSRIL